MKPTTTIKGEKGSSGTKMMQQTRRKTCVVTTPDRKFNLITEIHKMKKINWTTLQKMHP